MKYALVEITVNITVYEIYTAQNSTASFSITCFKIHKNMAGSAPANNKNGRYHYEGWSDSKTYFYDIFQVIFLDIL